MKWQKIKDDLELTRKMVRVLEDIKYHLEKSVETIKDQLMKNFNIKIEADPDDDLTLESLNKEYNELKKMISGSYKPQQADVQASGSQDKNEQQNELQNQNEDQNQDKTEDENQDKTNEPSKDNEGPDPQDIVAIELTEDKNQDEGPKLRPKRSNFNDLSFRFINDLFGFRITKKSEMQMAKLQVSIKESFKFAKTLQNSYGRKTI